MSFSDYATIPFSLLSKDLERRGPGFFKFKNSLFEDKNFIEGLKENIVKYKKYNKRYLIDKRLLGKDQGGN